MKDNSKREIAKLEKALQAFDRKEEGLRKDIKKWEKMKENRRLRYIILGAIAAVAVVLLGLSFVFHEKPVPYREEKSVYMELEVLRLFDDVGGTGVNQLFTFLTPDGTMGYISFSEKEKEKVNEALFALDNETVTQTFYGTIERRQRTFSMPTVKSDNPADSYSSPGSKLTYRRTYDAFEAKTTNFQPQQRLFGLARLMLFAVSITLMFFFILWDSSRTARKILGSYYGLRITDVLYSRMQYNRLTGSKTLDIPFYEYGDEDVGEMRRISHLFAPEFAELPLYDNSFQEDLTALSPVVDLGPLRSIVETIWDGYKINQAGEETEKARVDRRLEASSKITIAIDSLLGATKTLRVEEKVAVASDEELIKAWTVLGNYILFASGKLNVENMISFRNYLYHCFEERKALQEEKPSQS